MKYLYSTVRYVPDAIRGEFVNVAVLVGRDDPPEWSMRTARSLRRAALLGGATHPLREWLEATESSIAHLSTGHQSDQQRIDSPGLIEARSHVRPSGRGMSWGWLQRTFERSRSTVQLSEPAVIIGESSRSLADDLFERLVAEPATVHRTKTLAARKLLAAYRHQFANNSSLVWERPSIEMGLRSSRFDFAVAEKEVAQLSHVWSFAGKKPEETLSGLRAWGYDVRRLRDFGGRMRGSVADSRVLIVPADVPIRVIFLPPPVEREDVLRQARDIWKDLGVGAFEAGQEDKVAMEALQALA